jgi:hypothetical protein
MAFFMFFIVISGIVLMNVFVAVLLDATSKEKVYFGTFKHPAFSDGKDTEIRVKFEKATSGQWNVPGQTESITIRQLDSRRVHLEDTDKVICLQGHSDNSGVIIKGLMTMKGDNRTGSFILQAENPFFEGDPIVFKGMNAYQFPDLIVDGEIRAVIGEMVEFDIFPQGGKRSIRKESCNYNAGCIKKATSSDGVMCIKAEEDQEITVDDIEWFRASVLKKVRAIGKQVEAVASKVEAM